jgi:hypothetical protein
MKKIFISYVVTLSLVIVSLSPSKAQSVAINTDGTTADASAMLEIKSTTRGLLTPRMTLAQRNLIGSPATGLMIYQTDNTPGYYYYNGSAWIQFSTGSATNFWTLNGINIFNNNTGNVGIGTNSPATSLHIKRDNEALRLEGTAPYLSFFNNSGTYKGFLWQGPGENMSIGTAVGNTAGRMQFYFNGTLSSEIYPGGEMLFINNGTNSGNIKGATANLEIAAKKLLFGVQGQPGNLILQADESFQGVPVYAGLVGIGTATPTSKLTVQTGDGYGIIHTNGTISVGTYVSNFTPPVGGWLGTRSNHPLIFFTNNSFSQMILLQNGNVGIGTTNPTYKLSVNGNIRSKEVVVETGWADYVFNENYKLRPLEEVEKFIQLNNHLPNIPSAKEVEEKGLSLGDTQKKMMEKIEELTLYVIELKKEIEGLKTGKK